MRHGALAPQLQSFAPWRVLPSPSRPRQTEGNSTAYTLVISRSLISSPVHGPRRCPLERPPSHLWLWEVRLKVPQKAQSKLRELQEIIVRSAWNRSPVWERGAFFTRCAETRGVSVRGETDTGLTRR